MFSKLMIWLIGKYLKKKVTILSSQTIISDQAVVYMKGDGEGRLRVEEVIKRDLVGQISRAMGEKGLIEIEQVYAPHISGKQYRATVLILQRFL